MVPLSMTLSDPEPYLKVAVFSKASEVYTWDAHVHISYWRTQRVRGVYDDALYKFTYLLTYWCYLCHKCVSRVRPHQL